MGQQECLDILTDEWQNTRQIATKLNQRPSVVINSLRKLYKCNEVFRKEKKIGHYWVHLWRKK